MPRARPVLGRVLAAHVDRRAGGVALILHPACGQRIDPSDALQSRRPGRGGGRRPGPLTLALCVPVRVGRKAEVARVEAIDRPVAGRQVLRSVDGGRRRTRRAPGSRPMNCTLGAPCTWHSTLLGLQRAALYLSPNSTPECRHSRRAVRCRNRPSVPSTCSDNSRGGRSSRLQRPPLLLRLLPPPPPPFHERIASPSGAADCCRRRIRRRAAGKRA